jgi:hypothetical protein
VATARVAERLTRLDHDRRGELRVLLRALRRAGYVTSPGGGAGAPVLWAPTERARVYLDPHKRRADERER